VQRESSPSVRISPCPHQAFSAGGSTGPGMFASSEGFPLPPTDTVKLQFAMLGSELTKAIGRGSLRRQVVGQSHTSFSYAASASFCIQSQQVFHLSQFIPTHHFSFSRRPDRGIPLTQRRKQVSKRPPRRATLTCPLRPLEFWSSLCNDTEDTVQNYNQNQSATLFPSRQL
jgi:hypothetical protein